MVQNKLYLGCVSLKDLRWLRAPTCKFKNQSTESIPSACSDITGSTAINKTPGTSCSAINEMQGASCSAINETQDTSCSTVDELQDTSCSVITDMQGTSCTAIQEIQFISDANSCPAINKISTTVSVEAHGVSFSSQREPQLSSSCYVEIQDVSVSETISIPLEMEKADNSDDGMMLSAEIEVPQRADLAKNLASQMDASETDSQPISGPARNPLLVVTAPDDNEPTLSVDKPM